MFSIKKNTENGDDFIRKLFVVVAKETLFTCFHSLCVQTFPRSSFYSTSRSTTAFPQIPQILFFHSPMFLCIFLASSGSLFLLSEWGPHKLCVNMRTTSVPSVSLLAPQSYFLFIVLRKVNFYNTHHTAPRWGPDKPIRSYPDVYIRESIRQRKKNEMICGWLKLAQHFAGRNP